MKNILINKREFLINNLYKIIDFLENYPKKIKNSSLFRKNFGRRIIKNYYGYYSQLTNEKTGNLGFGFLHYSMINAIDAKNILCIGSCKGFIPAICALACKEKGSGHVHFVDLGLSEEDNDNWGGIGFWKTVNVKKHFSQIGVQRQITMHNISSKEFFKKNKMKWDYIYIDGDHSYSGVKHDYVSSWSRLKKGGLLGFHDIDVKDQYQGQEYGVRKLWKEIVRKNKIQFINSPKGASLGFVQK